MNATALLPVCIGRISAPGARESRLLVFIALVRAAVNLRRLLSPIGARPRQGRRDTQRGQRWLDVTRRDEAFLHQALSECFSTHSSPLRDGRSNDT